MEVLSELFAEENPGAVEWPLEQLYQEARSRGIATPASLVPVKKSRHLIET